MVTQPDTAPLLTAKQVAARLSLSLTGVYALCDAGELAHNRVGAGKRKRIRVSESDLADYLSRSVVEMPGRRGYSSRGVQGGYSMLRRFGYQG